MKLGKVLAGYRESKKQSLEALAGEIGIDPIALWRLEKGKFRACKQWPAILVWLFTPDK